MSNKKIECISERMETNYSYGNECYPHVLKQRCYAIIGNSCYCGNLVPDESTKMLTGMECGDSKLSGGCGGNSYISVYKILT